MQKRYFSLVLVLIILSYSTVTLAHISKEIPFSLQIQKNITRQWTPTIELEKPGYISYLEGGGGCNNEDTDEDIWGKVTRGLFAFLSLVAVVVTGGAAAVVIGAGGAGGGLALSEAIGGSRAPCWFSGYQIHLYDNTTQISSIKMTGGNCKELWIPALIYRNSSNQDVITPRLYMGYSATNITFNGTPDCCGLNCGYLKGKLEIHQFIKNITINQVQLNEGPVQLGVVSELVTDATLQSTLTRPSQIIDENILVQSPNKDVKVWFGTNDFSAGSQTTTDLDTAQIWACADIDWNGECDSKQAQDADCTTALDKDYYKGECCSKTRIENNGCQYIPTINAYCGLTPNGEAQFATPHEGGEIHDFRGCQTQQQLTFNRTDILISYENGTTKLKGLYNETNYFTCNPISQEYTAIGNIDLHEYYCDKTKTEMYECGGNQPYSTLNTRTTGKNITINGKTNYCLEQPKKFTTNLDYTTNQSCYNTGDFSLQSIQAQQTGQTSKRKPHTGQIWTGTRCCSEEDDILGNDNNEYYSEDYTANSQNYTRTAGGCWNSTYVPAGKTITTIENYATTALNNSVINYNGTFHGCLITDTKLLQMQNTDPHTDQRKSPVES